MVCCAVMRAAFKVIMESSLCANKQTRVGEALVCIGKIRRTRDTRTRMR